MNTSRNLSLSLPVLLLAVFACGEETHAPTAPQVSSLEAAATAATPLSFVQVSVGAEHSCGVTADDRGYCWGDNQAGELGDGTTIDRKTPRAVTGGLRFRFVSAGFLYTCGLTTADRAYCWGRNVDGTLGDGSTVGTRLKPVAVVGGRSYRQLRAGHDHVCAVTVGKVAFCWGQNVFGQLGIGPGSSTNAPARVKAGGLVFSGVFAGAFHSCGLTTDNRAWCWGRNEFAELGDGTQVFHSTPVAVTGGLTFTHLTAGGIHTCGVTAARVAYCWGGNNLGQLGDGTRTQRLVPTAVAGNLRFSGVSAGGSHTCGVTVEQQAYCWGSNTEGQLGDGTSGGNLSRPAPVAVLGGHRFASMGGITDGAHTCGVTTADRAYCWGDNSSGEIGDGTHTRRTTPTLVAGHT